jgi:hypothetical protein
MDNHETSVESDPMNNDIQLKVLNIVINEHNRESHRIDIIASRLNSNNSLIEILGYQNSFGSSSNIGLINGKVL